MQSGAFCLARHRRPSAVQKMTGVGHDRQNCDAELRILFGDTQATIGCAKDDGCWAGSPELWCRVAHFVSGGDFGTFRLSLVLARHRQPSVVQKMIGVGQDHQNCDAE